MKIADELREMLREEYGITSVVELDAALRKTKGLNIGLFVAQTGRSNDEKKGKAAPDEMQDSNTAADYSSGDVGPVPYPERLKRAGNNA